jgi:hypothetical protein
LLQASSDRYNQIADEIELMQADPQYFYNYVTTVKAGIDWDENVPTSLKWDYISRILFHNRAMSLALWQVLLNECRSFQTVCRAHEENHTIAIQPGSYMPKAVKAAFQKLCATLRTRQLIQTTRLGRAITDMDAMRHHSKRAVVDGDLSNAIGSDDSQNLYTSTNDISLALSLVKDVVASSYLYGSKHELDLLAEELSHVRSSQRTNDEFSSLSLIDSMRISTFWGCQAIVESTHRDAGPKDTPSAVYDNPDARSSRRFSRNAGISDSSTGAAKWLESIMRDKPNAIDSIGKRLGPLLREFCDHPWPKSGSGPVWLEKATKSRQLLSAFWQALRDECSAGAKLTSDKIIFDTIVADMSFDTSPRSLAMVDEERRLHQHGPTAVAPKNAENQTPALQSTWGSQNAHAGPVRKKITKAKSVRTLEEEFAGLALPASSDEQNEPMLQDSVSQEPSALRIPVKQESLSVFNKMFSSGGTTSVRWIHVVQALTDAGMTAAQVPGSGVKFSNDRESIVLHKPHPEPVVDGVILRCQIGRGLQKWFSWDEETFVLRVKNAEEEQGYVDIE